MRPHLETPSTSSGINTGFEIYLYSFALSFCRNVFLPGATVDPGVVKGEFIQVLLCPVVAIAFVYARGCPL